MKSGKSNSKTLTKSKKSSVDHIYELRQQFLVEALNMGWQLAVVVLVPVIGGVELDRYEKTTPIWTIAGFLVAILGVYAVIRRVLNGLEKESKRK